jgi:saccharopine dehydrogenase-like NADP-dependent oxidoreductase
VRRRTYMRIVVLGGAGMMGVAAVGHLVNSQVFEEVVVADYNVDRAKKIAGNFKGQRTKVSMRFVDANVHDDLVTVMRDADVVAGTLGPYYKYGVKVLEAAIDAGVNFVDINDDYDSTRDALALHDKAEKAGITAIIGLGNSPGVTNMLAKYGADKLDQVDEIHTSWVVPAGHPAGSGATDHWFHCITGRIPTYRDGKWVDVPARSEPEIVDFGPPVGMAKVYNCGHAEPITLPRYIEGVKVVTNKGGLLPTWFMDEFDHLIDLGFASTESLHLKDASLKPRDFTVTLLSAIRHFATKETVERIGEFIATEPPETGSRTDIIGNLKDETIRLTYRFGGSQADVASMSGGTSQALSIGVQMLAKGEIKAKGVFAPEGCIDPKAFIAELTKGGRVIYETEERTRALP